MNHPSANSLQFSPERISITPNWYNLAFLLGVWLLINPYNGIRHDGILYIGQALSHIYPDNFSEDIFFMHGSQDSYSIFSRLYVGFIKLFGVANSAMILQILSLISLILIAYCLLKSLIGKQYLWISLLFITIFPGYYGGFQIFSFTETFLTARNIAESLSLLSIYLLYLRRELYSLLCIAISLLFHPIIALPVLVIWWLFHCLENPKWWWSIGLVMLPFGLGLYNIAPFNQLFVNYDKEWLDIIKTTSATAFIFKWRTGDLLLVAYDSIILLVALRFVGELQKKLLQCVLITGVGGIVVTSIGADLLNNVLLTGMQFWRSHWIMHFFALAFTPIVYTNLLLVGNDSNKLLVCALLVILIGSYYYPSGPVSLIILLLLLFSLFLLYFNKNPATPISKRLLNTFYLLCIGFLFATSVKQASIAIQIANSLDFQLSILLKKLASIPPIIAIIVILYLKFEYSPKTVFLSKIIAIIFLFVGLSTWDQRGSFAAFIENQIDYKHPFLKHISPQKQVYWQGQVLTTWLILKRPSYLSTDQGAGLLFNRNTALEYSKRFQVIAGNLSSQEKMCTLTKLLKPAGSDITDSCYITSESLNNVCLNLPDLDFLVLESPVKNIAFEDQWSFRLRNSREIFFYLYSCEKLRTIP